MCIRDRLGAVIDTAMSIATTIEEIKYRRPDISAKELLKSGIKIGGDMMGTMSNTLILAFTGGSLSTLVVFYAYEDVYKRQIKFMNLFYNLIYI